MSRHGVENDDVLHAIAHASVVADMGDDTTPLRTLTPDLTGQPTCSKSSCFTSMMVGDSDSRDEKPLQRVAPPSIRET